VADNLLSDDEKAYFIDMESLFNHPGWERLTREMRAEAELIPQSAFRSASNFEKIIEARARLEALETLIGYPDAVDQRRQHLEMIKQQAIEEVRDL